MLLQSMRHTKSGIEIKTKINAVICLVCSGRHARCKINQLKFYGIWQLKGMVSRSSLLRLTERFTLFIVGLPTRDQASVIRVRITTDFSAL